MDTDPSGYTLIPIPRLAANGRWRVEAMRSYERPLILWFTRGQGRITLAGKVRGYGANNLVYVPPHSMHAFEVGTQVYGMALFLPPHTAATLPQKPLHLRLRDKSMHLELTALFENIQHELEGDLPYRTEALDLHAGYLALWLARREVEQDATRARPDATTRLVERFTTMVEAQYHSGMSVQDYAEALGVTPTHLSRACRAACGRPASKILSDRIISEARRLLADTDTPVNKVASQLGFNSPAYFTRAFQTHTGKTPTDFRRAQ